MRMLEKLATKYLERRGHTVLQAGWRGLAVGGAMAHCEIYDVRKTSFFTVNVEPYSQLVAVNHSLISIDKTISPTKDDYIKASELQHPIDRA